MLANQTGEGEGEYCIWANLSFIQHKTLEIICNSWVCFLKSIRHWNWLWRTRISLVQVIWDKSDLKGVKFLYWMDERYTHMQIICCRFIPNDLNYSDRLWYFSVTCVIVSLSVFWGVCQVTLRIYNFTISVTLWHLAFNCASENLGMSMSDSVMRCMPMLHDGLQVG